MRVTGAVSVETAVSPRTTSLGDEIGEPSKDGDSSVGAVVVLEEEEGASVEGTGIRTGPAKEIELRWLEEEGGGAILMELFRLVEGGGPIFTKGFADGDTTAAAIAPIECEEEVGDADDEVAEGACPVSISVPISVEGGGLTGESRLRRLKWPVV